MKILFGNNTLDWLAGSETWCLTLAAELKRLGHEVRAYSPQLGFIAMQMEGLGISCVSELKKPAASTKFSLQLQDDSGADDPDVIICNHNQITKDLHAAYPGVPIIATVHGILHKDPNTGAIFPEHPVTEFKVDQYVAVSEEVQGLLKEVYGIDSVIIRNFFDLEKFKWTPLPVERMAGPIPETGEQDKPHIRKPETFLINTNYLGKGSPEIDLILEVAKHYDSKVIALGANFTPSWDLQEVIKDADVVVGMGRSVLEGFVMGKIALVHGRWGTGGVLTQKTYDLIKETNFSGRNSQGKLASAQEIIAMIDESLTDDQMAWQLNVGIKNHDVREAAKKFLEIAEKLRHEDRK